MNPPSERQIVVANYISENLAIPLPDECSAKAYYEYIAEYLEASKEAYREQFRRQRHVTRHSISGSRAPVRLQEQRRADWEATHLSSQCHATRVLDGETDAPSWWHGSTASFQRHLRSLGFRPSQEEAELRRRNQEWGGLEGPPEWW